MRRLLALLLCMALLPVLSAQAEGREEIPLFRLVAMDEGGREVEAGTAILALDSQILFTSAFVEESERVMAYGPDGAAHEVQFVIAGDNGITALVLAEAADETVPLFSAGKVIGSRLIGLTANGLPYDLPAAGISWTTYQGQEASLVSAAEPLRPGAVLADSAGALIGMTVAEWGEGEARYVALTGDAFVQALLDALVGDSAGAGLEMPQEPGDDTWLNDVALNYEDGLLNVDWRDCRMEDVNDESVITVYLECPANLYYTYYSAKVSDGVISLDVVPGYEYDLWVRHSHGKPEDGMLAGNPMSITIPEQGDFTDYGFTNECYLAWAPADEAPDTAAKLPALEDITAETLTDETITLYLQAINTYEVEEELETSLIFVLQTPEGHVFHSLSGYIFMPEIQQEDIWNAEVTTLFRQYQTYNGSGSFAPGEYTLSYLIGGQWAGRIAFTLE